MSSFKSLVIANPSSAGGSLGTRWRQLSAIIDEHLDDWEYRFTEGPRDATRITSESLQDYEMIVAMGGDGTISEVVNGYFDDHGAPLHRETVLGVLPYGTGGDFRKVIGAPKKLALAAPLLRGRSVRPIDVGQMTYTTREGEERRLQFINIASFGIGGLVDEYVNTTTKALGGRVSFAIATVRAMLRYKAQLARIKLDDGDFREVRLHVVAVSNGQYFGGGMQIAPNAVIDDGLFDVVTLPPMTMADLLLRGHKVYKGTHLGLPEVTAARAKRVEAIPVDPKERILLDVDGETPGMLPAIFEVLPGALRLKQASAV